MGTSQVAPQGFQLVAGRDAKVLDAGGRVEYHELAKGGTLHLRRETLDVLASEEILRAAIGKARNHAWQY
jgi:hypothetical protein